MPQPAGTLAGLEADWFYLPGPYSTVRSTDDGIERARVSAERDGVWTVTIGDPPTTIEVERLPDGRPATASIANPDRNETAVFDPPLALVPVRGQPTPATESVDVTLYRGLTVGEGERPTRTGNATRTFFAVEPATWVIDGREVPAQRMVHELLLDFGAAKVRQRYDSLAVRGRGIVQQEMIERVTFLRVRVGGRTETFELTRFIDER